MAARKDYECDSCGNRHLDVDSPAGHIESCPICQKIMRVTFLKAPAIRTKTATRVEKGIKKDLIEAAKISEYAEQSGDKNVKREVAREVEKLKTMEVRR